MKTVIDNITTCLTRRFYRLVGSVILIGKNLGLQILPFSRYLWIKLSLKKTWFEICCIFKFQKCWMDGIEVIPSNSLLFYVWL